MNLVGNTVAPSTLYYGDCLDVMKQWDPGQVDLIYLDPPFNSNQNYNVLFGKDADRESGPLMAFSDTWQWDGPAAERVRRLKGVGGGGPGSMSRLIEGLELVLGHSGMLAYVSYMAERLAECHRILKDKGSIYLHCDPTASHYLKAVMDGIFESRNFRNEIIWRIGWLSGFKTQKRGWIRNHDTILYYLKTPAAAGRFNKELIPYPKGYVRRDGKPPRGKGVPIEDTWNCSSSDVLDSIMIKSFSREKIGYPTQKPIALLERIVKASSNEGEMVLDPFCGCGTTVVAAERLKRRWAGIDISAFAVDTVMRRRLKNVGVPVDTKGIPVDLEGARVLAGQDPFMFEAWAVSQVFGLAPNAKQRGDRGIDGWGTLTYPPEGESNRTRVIAQVKSGGVTKSALRDFLHNLNDPSNRAIAGVFITLTADQVTGPMRNEAAAQGTFRVERSREKYPRCQFWALEEWFDAGKDNRFLPNLPPMRDPITGKEMNRTFYD